MISKLLSTSLLAVGFAICIGTVHAASEDFDFNSVGVTQASATNEAPPTEDDLPVPELKTSILAGRKSGQYRPESADSEPSSAVLKAPKLLPPNLKSRPAYASGISNWPQSSTSGAAQNSSTNAVRNSAAMGQPKPASATSAPPKAPSRGGDIQRPSQQFAQKTSATSEYRADSQMGQANHSPDQPVAASMSQQSIAAGRPSSNDAMHAWDESGSGNSCDTCDCSGGCNNCCYNGFNLCGDCGWFGSVDYLLLRPSFSEDQAYLKRVTTTDVEENVTITDTVVHHDFGYQSGLRTSFGYRCDCNEEIRFTYWNYGATRTQSTGIANDDGSILFAGQLELNTTPGQHINIESGLRANLYDIEYSKCCCNPCNTCECCPPWTLKYSAGVRIAEIGRHDDEFLIDVDGSNARAALVSSSFIGAGPRVGIEGRRFLCGGRASLFAKTNLSLLLGEYNINETRLTPGTAPALTEHYFDSHDRVIPVAEIELGGAWQMNDRLNLSAGYLFQAWWDLGAFEQIQGNVFLNPIDDSNIMAFDGLFARLEFTY